MLQHDGDGLMSQSIPALRIRAIEDLLADGDFAMAAERAEDGLRGHPEISDFYCLHATALAALREPTAALATLQRAVSDFPGDGAI